MSPKIATILALGGKVRRTPVGRYETDYYMQRVVIWTCSVATALALLFSLIPSRQLELEEASEGVKPGPGVAEILQYTIPPSLNGGMSKAPTIARPDFPIPIPVADHEVWEEPVVGPQGGSHHESMVGDSSLGGSGSEIFLAGWAPSDRQIPEVFLFTEVAPELVSLTDPSYPDLARDAGVEGTVHVRVLVSEEGFVLDTVVMEGNPLLNQAAMEAASTAVFRPAQQSGQPVRTWVVMPIEFTLRH